MYLNFKIVDIFYKVLYYNYHKSNVINVSYIKWSKISLLYPTNSKIILPVAFISLKQILSFIDLIISFLY